MTSKIECPQCKKPVIYHPKDKKYLICSNENCPNYVVFKLFAEFVEPSKEFIH